ncbi:hypothetical protein ACS0TY_026483 [Phlomoides rotata]
MMEDAMYDLFSSDHSFSDDSMCDENKLQDASTSDILSNAPNNPLSADDHHSSFDSQLYPSENGNNNQENESEYGPISSMQFKSIKCIFEAYQEHTKRKGFSIIKRTCHKSGPMGYNTH